MTEVYAVSTTSCTAKAPPRDLGNERLLARRIPFLAQGLGAMIDSWLTSKPSLS